ncbi:MAG TPA: MBL fold metallo-hydrolase [Candidatus Eremiobacteraceae bacterium]|nr:MBL fold metallo-hydrolase [Candidatus Eremiobacteraceae bacterium]
MASNTVSRIAPDVWRITLPLPFRLRSVNLYLVRGAEGYSLIDAGLDTQAARDAYDGALREIGVAPESITRLYVTHMHPDHIGMSGRHASAGATAFIMADEERRARYVWGSAQLDDWVTFLARHGMNVEAASGVMRSAMDLRKCVTLPDRFEYVADADDVPVGDRTCRVLWTPGHSDHHYVLVDDAAKLIFAGDHLLPAITPNIGLYPECRPDPLGDYLQSLAGFARESAYRVLPAHGDAYHDLPARLTELRAHHDERLEGVRSCVTAGGRLGATAFDIVGRFWGDRLSSHEVRFALVEVAAHLEYLRLREQLMMTTIDGVDRYRPG